MPVRVLLKIKDLKSFYNKVIVRDNIEYTLAIGRVIWYNENAINMKEVLLWKRNGRQC